MRQKKWFGTNSSFTRGCILAAALYFLLAGIFYYAAGEQLYERRSENEIPGAAWESPTPEVTKKQDIRQDFLCEMDILEHFTVAVCTFARENTGKLVIRLYDLSADRELFQESLRMEELTDGQVLDCVLTQRADNVRGHVLCVTLTSDGTQGSAFGCTGRAAAVYRRTANRRYALLCGVWEGSCLDRTTLLADGICVRGTALCRMYSADLQKEAWEKQPDHYDGISVRKVSFSDASACFKRL